MRRKHGLAAWGWVRAVVLAVVAVLGVSGARAQCTPAWQPFDPTTASFLGVNGEVNATTMWDPDGPGPQTPKLVVGGEFTLAGNVLARNIALYDAATGGWSALGSGITSFGSGTVNALTTLPNGDLIAGGSFTAAGGVTVNRIARWNGSAWSALGSGMDSTVRALTTLPNGDLIAGGVFTTAGGVTVNNIARWNGSAWSALGTGMSGGLSPSVNALTTLPNGDLIAGGSFFNAGGVQANALARWNGSAWSALGTGVGGSVFALAVMPNGDLIAGGEFFGTGSVTISRIARWNGSAWSALGTGMNTEVLALTTLPNGDLIAGGSFTSAGGVVAPYIARYGFVGAAPTISEQPVDQPLVPAEPVVLSAAVAAGWPGVSVQWMKDGVPIVDGPGGASAGGGNVSGAAAALPQPTNGNPVSLVILNPQPSDAGLYTAVFSSPCGASETLSARVAGCAADYNRDGTLNLDDLGDFITDFYIEPAIPGGVQPAAPTYAGVLFAAEPCAAAPDAWTPYALDAYRVSGYRAGFSIDGSNACPIAPEAQFPNLDNLNDFITAYYAAFEGGC
jgi:hypothetical protein